MIKINLKSQGQSSSSFVGNFDISMINLPMLLGALLFTGTVPMFVDSYLQGLRADIQVNIDEINVQKKKFDKELESLADIEKRILTMEKEEVAIKSRVQVLQNLLKEKSNPMKLMHYMSEHIPSNVWITKIEIKQRSFLLEGSALDFDSIGKFVESLNQSVFFNKTAKMEDYKTKQTTEGGARQELFKIVGNIARFE